MKKIFLAVLVVACHDHAPSDPGPAKGVTVASVTVTSGSFANDAPIPVAYTCDGTSQSPELSWTPFPDSAKSFALVVDDPDAPSGKFTHWIAWNLKPSARMLGANANGGLVGGMSGTNDVGHVGYDGPCPPKGQLHHYHFRFFGLDVASLTTLKQTSTRADLDAAMNGHIVAQGDLVGTFQH